MCSPRLVVAFAGALRPAAALAPRLVQPDRVHVRHGPAGGLLRGRRCCCPVPGAGRRLPPPVAARLCPVVVFVAAARRQRAHV